MGIRYISFCHRDHGMQSGWRHPNIQTIQQIQTSRKRNSPNFWQKNPGFEKKKHRLVKASFAKNKQQKNDQLLTFPGLKISTTSQLPGFFRNLELLSKLLIFLLQSIHRLCFLLPVKNVERSYGDWAKYSQKNPKPEMKGRGWPRLSLSFLLSTSCRK